MESEDNHNKKAYLYLIKLLAKRDYSEFKLKNKLIEKKFAITEIELALEQIKNAGYLREDYYAEARIKAYMNKGYSQGFIQHKLRQEHVDVTREYIQEIFSEHRMTEQNQIEKLIDKKLLLDQTQTDTDEIKIKAKILRFLASKGHQGPQVNVLLNIKLTSQQ